MREPSDIRPTGGSLPRSRRRVAGMIVFGVVVGLLLAELCMRTVSWTPPVQIVRGNGLHTLNGVPVWGDETRANRACVEQHPERLRVLFFGSSITYGSGVTAEETFTTALEARLNELRPTPGFCVLNFAQPGFQFAQKYAVASVEAPRYMPALIVWESWVEWREYRMLGDSAYSISDFQLRPDGFIGIIAVPTWLNRALFLHSRLYEYFALNYGEHIHEGLAEREAAIAFTNDRLIHVVELARAVGAKLTLFFTPPLDRPFKETAAAPTPNRQVLLEFSRAQGIPTYALDHELNDQDYLKLRLDPCCHYNAEGHRALVPIMARIVLEQVDSAPDRARSHVER